jgi:hypothetical protein
MIAITIFFITGLPLMNVTLPRKRRAGTCMYHARTVSHKEISSCPRDSAVICCFLPEERLYNDKLVSLFATSDPGCRDFRSGRTRRSMRYRAPDDFRRTEMDHFF